MRKRALLSLDSRYNTMIENAFYYSNPPVNQNVVREVLPPKYEFIKRILYKDLNKASTEKVRLMAVNSYQLSSLYFTPPLHPLSPSPSSLPLSILSFPLHPLFPSPSSLSLSIPSLLSLHSLYSFDYSFPAISLLPVLILISIMYANALECCSTNITVSL